ncbi:MAG TPA: hypothetical protein VEW47_15305 [Candidatus Dormibacteraeota bacterium]|nr:hypothetical protein [Candidatus Dormibacteraeota bacterium]
MAQSLFDSIEDIKLPEDRPKRSYKKVVLILAALIVAVGLGIGGYFGYYAMFPKKLTQRPVPMNMEKLLVELKDARDQIDGQTHEIYNRIQQFNQKMTLIGRKPVSFSQVFLQGLSAEEEQALDDLVRQEKDPSYRGILGQVVEDMKKIRDLQNKVTQLEGLLPGDGVDVKPGDTHMKLAMQYLEKDKGVPESRAKELISRLNIMETNLEKGMKVHFYYDPAKDFFGTWVAQGAASHSPLALVRAKEMRLIQEKDAAIAKANTLQDEKAQLEEMRDALQKEIAELETRKAGLESTVSQLELDKTKAEESARITGEKLAEHQNSVWYDADLAERLRARGVLKTVNKVENIGEVKFANNIDLSKTKSITLKPSQFGIDHISDVRIVPTYLKEGRDVGVRFADDGTVEVTVLNEGALRGQKILFVVSR